ncbi:Retrotransposon-derived protein PEG10 [Crotalus adamanteus]|uniref:Retrotransposon-derived protein PEG10 n=1 Tax=Crotalus adamanteus TaxID=8729 RepID=A0AAW1C676_CROAD
MIWNPPPISLTFAGDPDRLAVFLSHVLKHLDRYTTLYSSNWAMVVAVTASLQGEAADLYSDQARELADVGLFLDALKMRFEDPTRLQRVEAQLVGLQQRGRPVQEYIREFQKDQPVGGTTQAVPGTVRPRPIFRCFRCNRPGHRAAECGIPKPIDTPTAIGTPGATPKRPAEKSRVAYQLGQSPIQQPPDDASPVLQEYGEEGSVEDPMVSEPIVPFTIPITLTSPVTGESRIVNPS